MGSRPIPLWQSLKTQNKDMDLEVKNYIDKLNEELPQLLKWRKEILEQIDIDKDLPGWQVAEKYHQITSALNKTIDDLKSEIRELKKGREDLKELDVFGHRLSDELKRMLSWRREIMVETSGEQNKLNAAANARLEILADLNNQLINSRLSLDEIKAVKEDFVASLSAKEKTLALKENELAGRDKELAGRDIEIKKKEEAMSGLAKELSKERLLIGYSKKSLELDRQEIERQIAKIKSERIAGQELNRAKQAKLKKLDEKLSALNDKNQKVLFKEEALSKQEETITERFDQLDKDKKQLINQQSSLKRAIFMARLKGIKI